MERNGLHQTLYARVLSVAMTAVLVGGGAASSVLADEGRNAGLEYGLTTELRYDDNIFLSDTVETDSWILEALPYIRGTMFVDGNTYQLQYLMDHGEYFDSSEDTYTDHNLTVDINHRFTHRQAIVAEAAYRILTEHRGTGFSEEPNGIINSPDDFDHLSLGLRYLLGVPTAALRFEIFGKYNELDYSSSYVGDSRDYSSQEIGVQSRYRIGARTDALLEYRRLAVSYDNVPLDFSGNVLNLDSDEDYFLMGLAWEMTAKTKGEIKLGQSKRDFDEGNFSNSDFHWEANLEWRPKSYSRFILTSGRISQETYGSGLYVNSQSYDLSWLHNWSGSLRSELTMGFIEDTYEDSDRADDRTFWGAMLGYDYAPWLALELGYRYRENDSTLEQVDYKQNTLFLKASVEF